MSVYSMTGYASGRIATRKISDEHPTGPGLVIEMRSVNSRFLDLTLRLPDELRAHEPALRQLLTQGLKRGKVELRAALEGRAGGSVVDLPIAVLQQLASLQDKVRAWLPEAAALSVADVQRLAASAEGGAPDVPADALLALARRVLEDFAAARAREGARLVDLLRERMAELRTLAERAEPLVPQAVQAQKQRFIARWDEALADAGSTVPTTAAQERALAEAAAFAIRIDVAEELGRLRAHLDEIESVLAKGGEAGKRLDFLIQELHREANTLGSKSAALELSRISVDMKVLIEQMREQVQNLE